VVSVAVGSHFPEVLLVHLASGAPLFKNKTNKKVSFSGLETHGVFCAAWLDIRRLVAMFREDIYGWIQVSLSLSLSLSVKNVDSWKSQKGTR